MVISIKKICPQSLVRGHSIHDPGPGENLVAMLTMIFFYSREFQCADLILPLSDRADCTWCMTFLYYHVLLSYAVLHLFGF